MSIVIIYFICFIIQKWLINGGLGIGDWGLGIGDWGLGPIPNPQSPFAWYVFNDLTFENVFIF